MGLASGYEGDNLSVSQYVVSVCHHRLKGDLYGDDICDTVNRAAAVAMSSGRNRANFEVGPYCVRIHIRWLLSKNQLMDLPIALWRKNPLAYVVTH